jgi:hypothetical protein
MLDVRATMFDAKVKKYAVQAMKSDAEVTTLVVQERKCDALATMCAWQETKCVEKAMRPNCGLPFPKKFAQYSPCGRNTAERWSQAKLYLAHE